MGRQHFQASKRYPSKVAHLAETLADESRFREFFGEEGTPEAWQEFNEAYASASPLLNKMAEEHGQLMLQQQMQAGGGRAIPRGVGGAAGNGGKGKLYDRKAPGVAIDDVLGAQDYPLAAFFKAVDPRNENGGPVRLAIQNAMSERVPAEGGFLIPEVLRSDLLQLMLESAIIRPHARIISMDSLRVPYPSIDDTSHSTSVFGGVQAFWAEEGAALTASAPAFARVILTARKLAFYTTIPNELIQDAGPMLEEWLRAQIPAAMAHFEDIAFIGNSTNGTGVGEPEGFLNSPAALRIPVGTVNTIRFADIAKAYARIWPPSLKSPSLVWLCSPDVREQLLQMSVTPLSAGTTQSVAPPGWLRGMQAIDAEPSTILGIPLVVSEKMPSGGSSNTTTPGALSLVDLDYYLIGQRAELQVAVSEQFLFSSDLTAYRCLERLDARSWIRSALTPFNGGNSLSPIVRIDSTATS